jgi:hypothetical protein
MRRRIQFAGILLGLGLPGALLGDPLGSLDQFCGGALSSVGCTETVAAYPVEVGAVVAVIETEKSHLSGADDCKNKLGVGTALAKEIAPYLDQVRVPVHGLARRKGSNAAATPAARGPRWAPPG